MISSTIDPQSLDASPPSDESLSGCWGPHGGSVADLTSSQQERLTQLLDDYLCGLEQGRGVDVQQMLRGNPDLAHVLRAYLDKLDGLHGIAAGFQSHGELEPLVSGQPESQVRSLQLGDYTIIRQLGRGGMGIVYEAWQNTLQRRVALKLLPLASMLDSRHILRFKNESHAAAQLQHPNIVSVYGVGVERGIHYYAMQYIEGQSIESWIEDSVDRNSPTQWRQTIGIAIDVAEALDCAHQCGIVHRDIKPSNLMLDAAGRVWVTDFGLARCQNSHSLTLSGHLVGTMRYMSPEQATGRTEQVDHRTDVYSLGTTVYEMLTACAAVPGDESASVLRQISHGSPIRLSRLMPQVPADLEVVLQKAMSKSKDERYATAREFADDLRAVLDNRPTLARPPSAAVIVSRWAARHRGIVLAATIICMVGMIGLLASLWTIAEKNRAVQASLHARDRHFRQAQEAVDRLGSRVAARLASVPGAEPIRQALLRDTLAYYQDFVAQATGDPQLHAELALTHSRIGSLVKELQSPAMSIAYFEQSEQIYQRLATSSSRSATITPARARNLNQLGLALVATGQHARARATYEQAIRLQSSIGPAKTEDQIDLALTRNNLGLLLAEIGAGDQAKAELTRAMECLTEATCRGQRNVLAVRGLAAALANLSSLSMDSDPSRSVTLLEQAIHHQLRVRGQSPNPLIASGEIATNYNNLGAAYLSLKQTDRAADAFSDAVQILRKLNGIAPLVHNYRTDLASSLNNLASAHHARGQFNEALAAAQQAVAVQSACLNQRPSSPAALSRLGVMHNNLASALEALGDIDGAIAQLQSAVQHQRAALSAEPTTADRYLLQHYSRLLRLQVQQRRWGEVNETSERYRTAAIRLPKRLLIVAEDFARLSMLAPAGSPRARLVQNTSALLASARDADVGTVDASLLQRPPFRALADDPHLRKVVQR